MARSAEVLIPPGLNETGAAVMRAIAAAVDMKMVQTRDYVGDCDWLVLWGVGAPGRSEIRDRHLRKGGRVILWDMGFFGRKKLVGQCKVSIDHDYATAWLDKTEPIPARWESLGIELRDDHKPDGHIVLAGIGPKQHKYQAGKIDTWERDKLAELRQRFPNRRIVYRPKPRRPYVPLKCETDDRSPIEDVLHGAGLAVCMHSNVAVDAIVAGVPFESEDGVSTWLRGKPYTRETRLDFLRRISRWQYRADEMNEAWQFLRGMIG